MRSLHAAAKRLKTLVLASSQPNMISKSFLKREGKGKRGVTRHAQKIFVAYNSKNPIKVSATFVVGKVSNELIHFVIKVPNS